MSSVIKLGKGNANVKVRMNEHTGFGNFDTESEDEYLERIEEEKHQQIFNAGREDAIRELQQEYSNSLQEKFFEYDNLMISVNNQLEQYRLAFDKIVIDASFLIASKVLKKSISESSIISGTITDSIQKIIGANSILFRLNPTDLELIKESKESFLENNSYSNIKFEADNRIDLGGCYVESEIGNVDARISSQLNELKSILTQENIVESE
jgi:flagellar assembly protein FliH